MISLRENWKKAHELCKEIDIKDISYVALALELDALFWTSDKKLKEGLEKRHFRYFISEKDF